MAPLTDWTNFYVIVGSSAGALIGLQFVVITLIADMPAVRSQPEAAYAFATPTIVHFASVLLVSGIMAIPWHAVYPLAILLGLFGFAGILFTLNIGRRMRRQTIYQPVAEDWIFHMWLPLAGYAMLLVFAFASGSNTYDSLFAVGASTALLLVVGIHNAWDAVTYHVFVVRRRSDRPDHPKAESKSDS